MSRKQSPLGSCPEHWEVISLDSVAELKHGYQFRTYDFTDEGIKVFKITQIKGNGTIDISSCSYIKASRIYQFRKFIIQNGDILMALSGATIGKIARYNSDEIVLQNYRVGNYIPLDESILSKDFFYYFLTSEYTYQQILANQTQSAQENVGKEDIHNMLLFLPPISEQKAIAAVLSSLDDKIDLLHRQNKTLETLAETLFRQWFVEEARDDWEEGCFGDVIEIFDSKRIPLSKMQRDKMKIGELYPYYGAATIMDYINDYIFDGDYILLGEDGTVRTDEGYPVLQYATGKFWVNNHTHVFQAKPPYNNFFIWNYLIKKNIDEIVTGAVQPKINQTNLKALEFPKFPVDLVISFNSHTEVIFSKINQNKSQIYTLEQLRDSLLPKLMSGEVRVEMED